MNNSLKDALCFVKVLALVIIALSVYRISENIRMDDEDFSGAHSMRILNAGRSDNRYGDTFIGSGANESPMFWPIGDWEQNESHNSKQLSIELSDARFSVAKRLNTTPYPGTPAQQQEDMKTASALGLVKSNGVWVVGKSNAPVNLPGVDKIDKPELAQNESAFSGGYSYFSSASERPLSDDELIMNVY